MTLTESRVYSSFWVDLNTTAMWLKWHDMTWLSGDRGEAIFKGRIRIPQHAQLTDSDQICRSIMLGDRARIIAMPTLEITADNVVCRYGAIPTHLVTSFPRIDAASCSFFDRLHDSFFLYSELLIISPCNWSDNYLIFWYQSRSVGGGSGWELDVLPRSQRNRQKGKWTEENWWILRRSEPTWTKLNRYQINWTGSTKEVRGRWEQHRC